MVGTDPAQLAGRNRKTASTSMPRVVGDVLKARTQMRRPEDGVSAGGQHHFAVDEVPHFDPFGPVDDDLFVMVTADDPTGSG